MGWQDMAGDAAAGGTGITNGPPGTDGLTQAQHGLLRETMEPLEMARAGLSDRALAFITQGTHESVLQELQALQAPLAAGQLLGQPGRLYATFDAGGDPAMAAAADRSLVPRAAFYASLPDGTTALAPLVRLGKVLAAADRGLSLLRPGAPVPDWLQYLVNDAVFATIQWRYPEVRGLAKDRAAWTVELVARLLAHEGMDEDLALQLVFECKALESYQQASLAGLVQSPAVAGFLLARPESARTLPRKLSASGRMQLAARIGKDAQLRTGLAHVLMALAADSAKAVREAAAPHLAGMSEAEHLDVLRSLLQHGDTKQRGQAIELLGRLSAQVSRGILATALERETSKPLQQALRDALARLDAAQDAQEMTLPEPPAWTPIPDTLLGGDALALLLANRAQWIEDARLLAQEEIDQNEGRVQKDFWYQQALARASRLSEDDMHMVLAVFNGQASAQDAERLRSGDAAKALALGQRIHALPAFGPLHLLRWRGPCPHGRSFWYDEAFQDWLARQPQGTVDLRALADVAQRAGVPLVEVARSALISDWNHSSASELLAPGCVWPFFMEHPGFIDEALGLSHRAKEGAPYKELEPGRALKTLALFPCIPARWLPRALELALGDARALRSQAQDALRGAPGIGRAVAGALAHTQHEVRTEAAAWLAQLQYAEAIPALRTALEKESRETARAAFLSALEALGEDISAWLSPSILLAEARKGLKAKPPAGLAWFTMDALPAARWEQGTPVEPEILQWWVTLACKLKEPAGNALLTHYAARLDLPSRQALGSCVLHQFVGHDTRRPTLAQATAHAQVEAPLRQQQYARAYHGAAEQNRPFYEADYRRTLEQLLEECKREKLAEYLGTAIGEKGMLAWASHAPSHDIVDVLRQYMRDYPQRRAQIEALLEAAAASDDPAVLQLLLGVSRSHRAASIQEKALALVQEIARHRGWTPDELADRTIPSAGLDDTGSLALPLGDRVFTLVLGPGMAPELRNPDGKVAMALPEPRQDDDPGQAKETRALLSQSRKALKEVVEQQTARLFEAMCTGRSWPVAGWSEYLHRHPVAGRLVQRLVWLNIDSQGTVLQSFRPVEDGSLLDAEDRQVDLAGGSLLRLGHAALVDAATADAWLRHFEDYRVSPLFAQMSRRTPAVALADATGQAVHGIRDRLGWTSDSLTLRNAFTRRGYQRAPAEEGGLFTAYTRNFAGAGVRVVIDFSGNVLPEKNVPAALKGLWFENTRARGRSNPALPLASVPPVLLAEAYADYLAVAQACTGFDPDWEKKMPW